MPVVPGTGRGNIIYNGRNVRDVLGCSKNGLAKHSSIRIVLIATSQALLRNTILQEALRRVDRYISGSGQIIIIQP